MVNREITYRIATKSDIPQLVEMRLVYLREDLGDIKVLESDELKYELYAFFNQFLNNEIEAFIAEYNGEIVSTSFTTYYHRLPHVYFPKGKAGIPINGYTKPAYRKMGLAGSLLKMSIQYAKERGVEVLHMESTEKGFPVCTSIGFHEMKYRPVQMILPNACSKIKE